MRVKVFLNGATRWVNSDFNLDFEKNAAYFNNAEEVKNKIFTDICKKNEWHPNSKYVRVFGKRAELNGILFVECVE